MKHKYAMIAALVVGTASLSSCLDDFANVNTNPTVVTKPDPRYLFTEAQNQFEGYDYFTWFYDYPFLHNWSQTTAPTGGNEAQMNEKRQGGGMGSQMNDVMNVVNELTHIVNTTLTSEEQAKYTYLKAICQPLMIYLAMLDTDMNGSMPYTEAFQARYTNPPLLKPKYDTQTELFDVWEVKLKETVEVLNNEVFLDGRTIAQQSLGAQDLIYKGDYAKWLKFANSLRLKLAARLIHEDKARALNIVKEVSKYPIMDGLEDDFIYNRGATDRHFPGGNDMDQRGAASMQLVNFMVGHQDPRVRVFFQKNDYNSVVIQAFFDNNQPLPSYINDKVETIMVDGKKKFDGWKAPGEPWVRYSGLPTMVEAGSTEAYPQYVEYFDKAGQLWKVENKTFYPYSRVNQFMFDKKVAVTYPDLPGKTTPSTTLYPWYGLYLSTAEVNLYLAEFKLFGGDIGFSASAESYLKKGVKYSVEAYDKLAGLNNVPYYHETYGPDRFDKSIKLQNGEVDKLLEDAVLSLNGSIIENLEKVYLQQYIHFAMMPADQYVTMRRSGCPMKNSTLYPMQAFSSSASGVILPRRFLVQEPTKDDQLGEIKLKAYADQGFSFGPDPVTLSIERVWYDKKAPNFGEGPKLN